MSYPQPIQKLIDAFTRFPGIGPKQAARFVFFLLREHPENLAKLSEAIHTLKTEIGFCEQCYKSVERAKTNGTLLCELCRDTSRTPECVIVVEKEADLNNIEKTKKVNGLYHVLGGTIDPLDSSLPERLHIQELFARLKIMKEADKSVEVILATNATTAGDTTALYLERTLKPLAINMNRLGRGLTTGAELEYADDITIMNALTNRKSGSTY